MEKTFSRFTRTAVLVVALWAIALTAQAAEGDAPPKEGEKPTPVVPAMKVEPGDWCVEHGVPESICSRCSKSAAAACKAKGDWCKKHGRADSQCFVCHPTIKDKWMALKPAGGEAKEEKEK